MKEVAVDIRGDIFHKTLEDADRQIRHCLSELQAGNFESGQVVIKIDITLEEAETQVSKMNKDGFTPAHLDYKIPSFQQKSTLNLKQKFETDNFFYDRSMALIEGKGGGYIVQPVKTSQIHLSEFGNED